MLGESRLTYVECPRDAWQGLDHIVPTSLKIERLQALLDAGFDHLDAGSFVSPRAVPQMADSEEAIAALRVPSGVDVLGIVANERGIERALATKGVTSVGYPLSVNDTFQRRNVGRGIEASWPLVATMQAMSERAGLGFVVYLSMAFGNPYREPWVPRMTIEALQRLRDMGVGRIALADTTGSGDAERLARVLGATSDVGNLGLHLHARPDGWQAQLEVALDHGVRWFEGALAGVGGCPFASDGLVGNLPSEAVLAWLAERGLRCRVDLAALPRLAQEARELARRYGGDVLSMP